jgi:ribosomal protein S6--L-glutamate ligase
MSKIRVGILDFCNIQNAERSSINMSRAKSEIYKPSLKGYALLSSAIKKLGHQPIIYYPEHCQLLFDYDRPEILYKGKLVKGCDVVIPRINVVSNIDLEISVIKQFELKGIPVVNSYFAISQALNKLRVLQILTKAGIRVPKTVVVRRFEYLDDSLKMLGGYPVILKTVFGTHGKGVAIIESRRSLYSALDILWKYSSSSLMLIQEYIADSENADYRAFVIGNKVVASMKRVAAFGDFRSNLNLGGKATAARLTKEEEKMAISAARAMGLDSCGVDILRTKNGPLVMELNPCAGLVGIGKASGVDVPTELIKYALSLVKKS